MSNKKRNIIISVVVIIIIATIALGYNIVKKNSKTRVGLNVETNNIKAGETVKVELQLENLDSNIYNMKGHLEYDESIFEAITTEDIENQNDWVTTYNFENKMFISARSNATSDDGTIMSLNLKAKSDVELSNTKVKVTELEVSGVDESKELDDTEIELKVKN